MSREGYFLQMESGDERGYETLAHVRDLTPQEAAAVEEAIRISGDSPGAGSGDERQDACWLEAESEVKRNPAAWLVACRDAKYGNQLVQKDSCVHPTPAFYSRYRLIVAATRFADLFRGKLAAQHQDEATQIPRRFEVCDEDTGEWITFDATNADYWGPIDYEEDWNGECWNYRVEEILYRFASGHWTLISERTHWEAPCSCGAHARRLNDNEAVDWLLRHSFDPPTHVAHLGAKLIFDPKQPNQPVRSEEGSTGNCERWYCFFRDSAAKRTGDEADSGVPCLDDWDLFTVVDDLTFAEVCTLEAALEKEFRGSVVDDGSIVGPLYEFTAHEESELATTPDLIRARRSWQSLQVDYELSATTGIRGESGPERLHWTAHELAEQIRKVRQAETYEGVSRAVEQATVESMKPRWDSERGELFFNGKLRKRYRQPAPNQRRLLDAFQEEGWPARILDPIPPDGKVDPKERLRETVRAMKCEGIRFELDGNEGVLWSPDTNNDAELPF